MTSVDLKSYEGKKKVVSMCRILYNIVNYLDEHRETFFFNTLMNTLNIDQSMYNEVKENIKDNPKINYDATSNTISYHPKYHISKENDVEDVILLNPGVSLADLAESSPIAWDAASSLIEQNKAYYIYAFGERRDPPPKEFPSSSWIVPSESFQRLSVAYITAPASAVPPSTKRSSSFASSSSSSSSTESKPFPLSLVMIYPNDCPEIKPAEEEFLNLWNEAKIKSSFDIQKELTQADMRPLSSTSNASFVKIKAKAKAKKRAARRTSHKVISLLEDDGLSVSSWLTSANINGN